MATAVADISSLMDELKESLLHAGGSEEDWKDLVERPNLPGWSVKWSSVLSENYADRLSEICSYYLKPDTLVEVEVRDADGDKAIGRAILQIKEIKNPRSQWSAKVRFVASDDNGFTDWGVLHFDDLQDFEVHFCKKAGCTVKPGAKSYGYFHVGRMRVLPISEALKLQYGGSEVVSVFSDYLQDHLNSGLSGGAGLSTVDANRRAEEGGEDGSDFETRSKRALDKAQTAKGAEPLVVGAVPKFGTSPQKPKPPRRTEKDRDARRREDDPQRGARDDARDASRALASGQPQLVQQEDRAGATPGRVVLQARQANFLDDISAQGRHDRGDVSRRDDTSGERDQGRKRNRGRSSERDGDKKKERSKRKRGQSSSSHRDRRPVRAELVIPADKKKRKKDPDPSDDPSSPGEGKRGRRSKKRDEDKKKRKKSKKDKKDKKRKKKDSRPSTSSSTSGASEVDLYGKEAQKYESLVEKSRRHPGKLLRSGLEQMARFLAQRVGEDAVAESWRDQKVHAYLSQVLFNQHPPSVIGMRNARELTTLSMALDLLMEQKFAELGDLLMQRMKAVEVSLTEGWAVANHQELIPGPKASLTTDQERSFAARQAVQRRKLEEAMGTRRKSG